jgi:hypothetical protein
VRYKHIDAVLPIRKRLSELSGGYERFVEPRFAASGGVSMNDAPLGSFVDRRYDRPDLISTGRRRGTHLLLNRPETCHNAVITKGSLCCLAGALGG